MDKKVIRVIVRETIEELKRSGLLKSLDEIAYSEMSAMLSAYYNAGENDSVIREAIKKTENDPYYKIIPLYFDYKYTIEQIAEVFDVEISTITRNKKRLCIQIYNAMQ